MISAIVFDLDGTLVQTERLKAISYARAATALLPGKIDEGEVIEAFKDVVGQPRHAVARALTTRFNLEQAAHGRMREFGVSAPWQAYVQLRLQIYGEMLADPGVIAANQWEHNRDLLERSRRTQCKLALATMSSCRQADFVLERLGLQDVFAFVATRDDVSQGKPDPEIYLLTASELGVAPEEMLVIEDSAAGVRAALAAGAHCIAVTTPFSRAGVHALGLLEAHWIVDQPGELIPAVDRLLQQEGAA